MFTYVIIIVIILLLLLLIKCKKEKFTNINSEDILVNVDETLGNISKDYYNNIINKSSITVNDSAKILKNLNVSGSVISDNFSCSNQLKITSLLPKDKDLEASSIGGKLISDDVSGLTLTTPNNQYKFVISNNKLYVYNNNEEVSSSNYLTSPTSKYKLFLTDHGDVWLLNDSGKIIWYDSFISHHVIMTGDVWKFEDWLNRIVDNKYFTKATPIGTTKVFYMIHDNGTNQVVFCIKNTQNTFDFMFGYYSKTNSGPINNTVRAAAYSSMGAASVVFPPIAPLAGLAIAGMELANLFSSSTSWYYIPVKITVDL
jgi:hypothetical protein